MHHWVSLVSSPCHFALCTSASNEEATVTQTMLAASHRHTPLKIERRVWDWCII